MEKRKGIALTDAQRLSWLQLIRSENVGAVTFINLIEHFGSAAAALDALPELSTMGGKGKPIRIASKQDAERELELAGKIRVRFIGMGEPDYPPYLRAIETPPPLLAVKGNPECFFSPSVGVVGSRNASATGKNFLLKNLVKQDLLSFQDWRVASTQLPIAQVLILELLPLWQVE